MKLSKLNFVALAAVFALAVQSAAATSATQEASELPLGPEILVAHPASIDGDRDAWAQDLVAALSRDPGSPYAVDAARLLADLETDEVGAHQSDELLDAFKRLAAVVHDQEAALLLQGLVYRGAARRRLSDDPYPLGEDMFDDFVTHWQIIGPVGRADDIARHVGPPAPGTPEVDQERYAESYPKASPVGVPSDEHVTWRPLVRKRNSNSILPSRYVYPNVGYVFALSFVRVPDAAAGDMRMLEIRCPWSYRALWNGRPVIDRTGVIPEEETGHARVLVPVNSGWNALLVRIPADLDSTLAARILMPDRSAATFEEPEAGAQSLFEFQRGGDAAEWDDPRATPLTEQDAGPYGPALTVQRLNKISRSDVALTIDPPESEEGIGPWRLAHLGAMDLTQHIDPEVRRRRTLDLISSMEADGQLYPWIRERRMDWHLSEDRPFEALEVADAWLAATPDRAWPYHARLRVLNAIDQGQTLARVALEDMIERFPAHAGARRELASILSSEGVQSRELELRWDRVQFEGSPESANAFLDQLGAAPDARVDLLLERIRHWKTVSPQDETLDVVEERILERLGRTDEVLEDARQFTEERPMIADGWWSLAYELLRRGDMNGAQAAIQRELAIHPSDPTSRRWNEHLGAGDAAERFFSEFAPDVDAAIARAKDFEAGASVVEVLDAGLLYVFPDGSSTMRSYSVTKACDQPAVDALSALPINDGTRSIRIITPGGAVKEPTTAGGEWVLPSLGVGDVIETVWDRTLASNGTGLPTNQSWRFASFDRAFPTSRWSVYLPNDLKAGEIKSVHFDGKLVETPFDGGVVHAFETSLDRQVPEAFMPSYEEVLPLAAFGVDQHIDDDLRRYKEYLRQQTFIPADLEADIAAFAAEHADAAASTLEQAKALYDAVEARTLQYEGDAAAKSVWQSKRGWPLFLFAAILDRAGIDFDWAVLVTGLAPELNPAPVQLFEHTQGFGSPILRLTLQGEEHWILAGNAPGTPFGMLPSELAGAEVFMLEPTDDGELVQGALPTDFVADAWDAEVQLRLVLDDAGDARLEGSFSSATPAAVMGLKQIREATDEQRTSFARNQAATFAPGADIETAEVVLDGSMGPGLVIKFAGAWPGLVSEAADGEWSGRIPFVPLELTARFGAAERQWPLALRSSVRLRATIRVETGADWTFVSGPASVEAKRDGFRTGLVFEQAQGNFVYKQDLIQRGAVIAPEEMTEFLKSMAEVDGEFERTLRLRRSDSTEDADDEAKDDQDKDGE